MQTNTLNPQTYGHYEGHSIQDTVWSVGPTPEAAIEALCKARWNGHLEWIGFLKLSPGDDPKKVWARRFLSDDGTSFKAAGIFVPGGAVLTWWV